MAEKFKEHILKHALQALALPAAEQKELFPDWVVVADELALDFDNAYQASQDVLTEQQDEILRGIDVIFEKQSGQFWQLEALETSDDWAAIRLLAKKALAAFGWPEEKPLSVKDKYVR